MTTIQPTFLYGVRSGVDNGVHFTGDSTLLYPAGSGVALVIIMISHILDIVSCSNIPQCSETEQFRSGC